MLLHSEKLSDFREREAAVASGRKPSLNELFDYLAVMKQAGKPLPKGYCCCC